MRSKKDKMEFEKLGAPTFSHLRCLLLPNESIVAEAGSMSQMDPRLKMTTRFNGGSLIAAILRKVFGGESLFVNEYYNSSSEPLEIQLTLESPGDVICVEVENNQLAIQPGSFLASTSDVRWKLKWSGFTSFFAREGLFKLIPHGQGQLFLSSFGAIEERNVDGVYLVDSGHLVAWEQSLSFQLKMSSSLFSSITSGEGFVTRLEGTGKIYLQTRQIPALGSWLNRFFI